MKQTPQLPSPNQVASPSIQSFMNDHDAKTLTFKSTLPVAITHLMLTFAAGSSFFFPLGVPFTPFVVGASLITPGAQRMQLMK